MPGALHDETIAWHQSVVDAMVEEAASLRRQHRPHRARNESAGAGAGSATTTGDTLASPPARGAARSAAISLLVAKKAQKAAENIGWAIAAYACCSASLLVINKVAVSAIPSASFVLISQFVASFTMVLALSSFGVLDKVRV